jgi:hypothetical protein
MSEKLANIAFPPSRVTYVMYNVEDDDGAYDVTCACPSEYVAHALRV